MQVLSTEVFSVLILTYSYNAAQAPPTFSVHCSANVLLEAALAGGPGLGGKEQWQLCSPLVHSLGLTLGLLGLLARTLGLLGSWTLGILGSMARGPSASNWILGLLGLSDA